MIVDGVRIAHLIEEEVRAAMQARNGRPPLRIFSCQPTFATRLFLVLKKALAEKLGVRISIQECAEESTTDEVVDAVKEAVTEPYGIIVQLPFPPHIDISKILAAIPASHDVDAIGAEAERLFADGKPLVLPPVVGAIAEITARHHVDVKDKNVVVVGEGRLVGAPAAVWFRQKGADVRTVNRKTEGLARFAREADVLVLGAGVPGLITP